MKAQQIENIRAFGVFEAEVTNCQPNGKSGQQKRFILPHNILKSLTDIQKRKRLSVKYRFLAFFHSPIAKLLQL